MDFYIIKSHQEHRVSRLSLAIHPYHPLHRADIFKFSQVGHHWCIHVLESIEEHCWWVHSYFSSSAPHILFLLFGWFVRWEVGGRTEATFSGISRFRSRQHTAFLCSSHLAFSLCILSASIWGIHTVVWMPYMGTAWKKSCFILSNRSNFNMIDNLSITFHAFTRCYVDITFKRWDAVAKVCEMVH